MFQLNKDKILLGVAILAIIITGVLIFANSSWSSSVPLVSQVLSKLGFGKPSHATAQSAIDYLNKNVLKDGQTATLGDTSEESGIIKMQVKIGANSYDSYVTKDGKLFFPEAFHLDSALPVPDTAKTPTPVELAKTDKPMLEAYVVSGCPYGLQMQRAMADAVKSQPSLTAFIKVRYIGAISGNTITAMHGVEEAQENLRQICIRDEQQSKYWVYVGCYMKKASGTAANGMPFGDTKTCQKEAGIDTAKLNSCVSTPSRGVAYAKEDFDLNSKYNIKGSPTLILNGVIVSDTDFGGRSADAVRKMVCDSSSTAPGFCSTPLNTSPASTSFSLTYAATNGATAATAANCAPAI